MRTMLLKTIRTMIFVVLAMVLYSQPSICAVSASPRQIIKSGHTDKINAVDISPDNKRALSVSSDKTMKLWDLATGKEIRTFLGHKGAVNAVKFLPDGKHALSGSDDGDPILWNLKTGAKVKTMHGDHIMAISIDKSGKTALSGGYRKTLQVWDLNKGRLLRTMSQGCYINSVWLFADGDRALSGGNSFGTKLWNVKTGSEIKSFSEDNNDFIFSVAVSKDNKLVFSSSSKSVFSKNGTFALTPNGGNASEKRVWELVSGKLLNEYTNTLSNESQDIPAENRLRMWDLTAGKPVRSFMDDDSSSITAISLSEDDRLVLTAAESVTMKLWDVASGKELRTLGGNSKR